MWSHWRLRSYMVWWRACRRSLGCVIFPFSKGDKTANGAYALCWVIGVRCPAVFTRVRSVHTSAKQAVCVTFALKDQVISNTKYTKENKQKTKQFQRRRLAWQRLQAVSHTYCSLWLMYTRSVPLWWHTHSRRPGGLRVPGLAVGRRCPSVSSYLCSGLRVCTSERRNKASASVISDSRGGLPSCMSTPWSLKHPTDYTGAASKAKMNRWD